jgi:DNA topoisomerase-1
LEQAEAIFAEPTRRGARTKAPLAELGAHPDTGAAVRVLDGRFGPYVTDGAVNASVPRGVTPEELTLDAAVELLRERAARAPSPAAKATRSTKATKGRKPAKSAAAKAKATKATATRTKVAGMPRTTTRVVKARKPKQGAPRAGSTRTGSTRAAAAKRASGTGT